MARRQTIQDTQPSPRVRRRRQISRLARLRRWLVLILILLFGWIAFWEGAKLAPRTNVLILGIDRRPEQGYVVRTDTILLTAIIPAEPQVALLSIPRDLYVEIPGYGPGRINTAHFWGENALQGNGPLLSMQTIIYNFGAPVHHYARVDFEAFRAVLDAVGGIDIDVEEAIVDEAYPTEDYGTMRIEIPAGLQHMDGETALRYARSRHGSSDFDRARRQQQVLTALAHRLADPWVWPRFPAVYLAVVNHVETDLSGWKVLLMLPTLCRVGPDGIERHVIGREMTASWTTPTGAAVLLPQWETITPLIQGTFAP